MKNTHGGRRTAGPGKRIGRKPAALPSFLKRFRATLERRKEFRAMLTGDAEKDFELLYQLLKERMTK